MKEPESVTTSERAGQWLGRVWHKVACRERRAIHWLAAKGLPPGIGKLLFRSVKVIVFAVLLYLAFWMAVLIAAAWYVVRFAKFDPDSEAEPEWRTGPAGYGLYTYDGHRLDPHVYDNES